MAINPTAAVVPRAASGKNELANNSLGSSWPSLYFFGLPGAGKSHCGLLAERELGYAFYDGDQWLPEDLRAALRRNEGFTAEQRDRFALAIAAEISKAKELEAAERGARARPLAVAQATFKKRHREIIRQAHPDIMFVWVRSELGVQQSRLAAGGNLVDPSLGARMVQDFEPPDKDEARHVAVVENGTGVDDQGLLRQLRAHLGISAL